MEDLRFNNQDGDDIYCYRSVFCTCLSLTGDDEDMDLRTVCVNLSKQEAKILGEKLLEFSGAVE